MRSVPSQQMGGTPSARQTVEQRLAALARESPDSDPLVQQLTVLLHRASRTLSRVYREALSESTISQPDYQVLRALVFSGPPYTLHPAQLAVECGQTKSTMTHRLDLLEQRGLLRRVADPTHRARVLAELTAEGHDCWRVAQRRVARAEERAVASISTADKQQLTDLLDTFLVHVQRDESR